MVPVSGRACHPRPGIAVHGNVRSMDDTDRASPVDVVIVGAGPAGLSAALWAHTLKLSYVLIESAPAPGGQLHRVYNRIVDYLGYADIADGANLARRFAAHLEEVGVRARAGRGVTHVDASARI